jgi:hypothetical protein
MKVEADASIHQGYKRSRAKYGACSATAEECRQSGDSKHAAQDDWRIHDSAAVATTVVFVGNFETADDTGGGGEQREAALKAALPDEVRHRLDISGRTGQRGRCP